MVPLTVKLPVTITLSAKVAADWTFKEVAPFEPERVIEPPEELTATAPVESKSNPFVPQAISTSVFPVALPTVILRCVAFVPILIAPAAAFTPISIAPPAVSRDNAPVD